MAVAVASGGLGGCRKEGGSSTIEAMLPGDAASKLSKQLLVFAEELPGDVEAFGYVDFGRPLEELTGKDQFGEVQRELLKDFSEMTSRRWGVELRKLSGLGVVVHQQQPMLVMVLPSAPPKAGAEIVEEVMLGQLGKVTVLGQAAPVAALQAAAKQGKRLHQSRPAWLKNALVHAAGNPIFFSGSFEKLAAAAPSPFKERLADILDGTATIGADGLALHLSCKPGTAEQVKTFVEGGIAVAKAQVDKAQAQLPKDGPGPLLDVLLRHYGPALWKSLEQKVSGDQVAVTLGWHAPKLPERQPAKLGERVVVEGEMAAAQINFGAPIIELMVAMTDVLEAPVDRAALRRELGEAMASMLGVSGLDPRAAAVSIGRNGVIVSLHNAPMAASGTAISLPRFERQLAAVASPWGAAFMPLLFPGAPELLATSVTTPRPALAGLGDFKLLADDEAMMRGYADLTQLPPGLYPPGLPKVDRVALAVALERYSLELVAAPGQGKALVDFIAKLPDQISPPQAEEEYQKRATLPATQEAMVIMQHYQRGQMITAFKPSAIDGDRVRFEVKVPPAQMQLMGGAMVIGIGAAVALPAFMSYMKRAESMPPMDLPIDSQIDPAMDLPIDSQNAPAQ